MTTYLYCYASAGTYDLQHVTQLQINTLHSAISIGEVDRVFQLGIDDIESSFKEKYKHIMSLPRGGGYWVWKYYFANRMLNEPNINDGDILIYSDSKMLFTNAVSNLVEVMNRDKIDVMTFWKPYMTDTLMFDEKTWTKRDCFILMDADREKYTHSMQGWGGFYIYRKSEFSRYFFNECLKYAVDYRVSTDSPNECGLPNYDSFKDHRHDQSILSLMAKKHNFYPYRYPTMGQFKSNICPIETFPDMIVDERSTYPVMLDYQQHTHK